jgi:hypothetical protein
MAQYGSHRVFDCPDGQQRTFDWHMRCNPNEWRIHFSPERPRIFVGYIGPHLPTVLFNS